MALMTLMVQKKQKVLNFFFLGGSIKKGNQINFSQLGYRRIASLSSFKVFVVTKLERVRDNLRNFR